MQHTYAEQQQWHAIYFGTTSYILDLYYAWKPKVVPENSNAY